MFKQRFQQCMQIAGLVALIALSAVGVLALVGGLPAWAQAGPLSTLSGVANTISYQGVLRNTDGSLVEGTYAMTFRLYDAASGGTKLHEETIPSVVVREGLFTVLLGDQEGQAIPAAAFKAPLYVSVQVDSGAEIPPRQRIAPVPYAVQLTDGLYVDDAGNVGVGKKDPADKLDVLGGITTSGRLTADTVQAAKVSGGFNFKKQYQVHWLHAGQNGQAHRELGAHDLCAVVAYEVSGVDDGASNWGQCRIYLTEGNTGWGNRTVGKLDGARPSWTMFVRANDKVDYVNCEAICINFGD